MLKRIIRRQLLKIRCVNSRVQELKAQQEVQRSAKRFEQYRLHWSLILSGQTMRDVGTEKPVVNKPLYIDSVNWG
jgi:hypothetical protein